MDAVYWSALTLGFAGSLHCVGMCGPIAATLPVSSRVKRQLIFNILLYNLGRVLTYAILGAVFGALGQALALAGFQQGLSLALGVLILLILILPKKIQSTLLQSVTESGWMKKFRKVWGGFIQRPTWWSFLVVGLLNGLLPCGLVYVALAGAITAGTWQGGAVFMAFFGGATVPVLFLVSWAGQTIQKKLRGLKKILVPLGAFSLAVLFILRGLNLDIPYISPDMKEVIEKPACCGG